MKTDIKGSGRSSTNYEITLNTTSKIYSQRTVNSSTSRDFKKGPKYKAIHKTKTTNNKASKESFTVEGAAIKNPDIKDFPTKNFDLTTAVLPNFESIQPESSNPLTYQGSRRMSNGFKVVISNHASSVDNQNQDSAYTVTPKGMSSKGSGINHSKEQISIEGENPEQSCIQTDELKFPRMTYKEIMDNINDQFNNPIQKVYALWGMAQSAERYSDHYSKKINSIPIVEPTVKDPVLEKTTDQTFKGMLEKRSLSGLSKREFIEKYIDELFKTGSISPHEYRQLKFKNAFGDYSDPFELSTRVMDPLHGKINIAETYIEMTHPTEGCPLSTPSGDQSQTPAKIITISSKPNHIDLIDHLRKLMPKAELEIGKVILEGDVFPTYIIEAHLKDESFDGNGRTLRFQISNERSNIYFNTGLINTETLGVNYFDFSQAAYPLTRPVTTETKQNYLDFMLVSSLLINSEELTGHFLSQGANPNKDITVNFDMLDLISGVLPGKSLEDISLEMFAHSATLCECGLLKKKQNVKEYPSAIMMVCYNDRVTSKIPLMKKLIDAGADVNIRESSKFTGGINLLHINPLYVAIAHEGDYELVSFLIENGADVFTKYKDKEKRNTFYCPFEIAFQHEVMDKLKSCEVGIDLVFFKKQLEEFVDSIKNKKPKDSPYLRISSLLAQEMLKRDPKQYEQCMSDIELDFKY